MPATTPYRSRQRGISYRGTGPALQDLAGGRIEEARKNLNGFFACWETSGVAVGYHIFSRRDWAPRPTSELYAYLILMVRDYHYWVGDPILVRGYWPMVEECAEKLFANRAGLVGCAFLALDHVLAPATIDALVGTALDRG